MNTVVMSGEYPGLIEEVAALGFCVIPTLSNEYLSRPVAFHADMQLLPFSDKTYVLKGSEYLQRALYKNEVCVTQEPGPVYPRDVLCNGKLVGDTLFCNTRTLDPSILNNCNLKDIKYIHVAQGYTGCSICAVDNRSIITADPSIAAAAEKIQLEVLFIQEGFIELPSYEYGFIGGCCGRVTKDRIIFTGQLSSHPDGRRIRRFIEQRGIHIVELNRRRLLDIGGIMEIGSV